MAHKYVTKNTFYAYKVDNAIVKAYDEVGLRNGLDQEIDQLSFNKVILRRWYDDRHQRSR